MKLSLTLIFCWLSSSCYLLNAQNTIIKGVVNYKDDGIEQVLIELTYNNKFYHCQTGINGEFEIQIKETPKKNTPIYLKASHIEFEPIIEKFTSLPQNYLKLNFKKKNQIKLNPITLTATKKSFIKEEAEKTTIFFEKNDLLNSSTTLEALTKLPGVIISLDGFIAQNGQLSTIYINGDPTNMTREQTIDYLANLPANTIKKVELIEHPGAKYASSISGGIINIITKTTLDTSGFKTNLSSSHTVNHNYKNANNFNLITRYKKLQFHLNTGSNYYQTDYDYHTNKIFIDESNQQKSFREDYLPEEFKKNHSVFGGLFFSPNSKSNFTLNYHYFNSDKSADAFIDGNSIGFTNGISSNSCINNFWKTSSHQLIGKFKQQIDTLGKSFSITAFHKWYDFDYKNNITEFEQPMRFSYSSLIKSTKLSTLRLDSNLPLSKKLSINTGVLFNNFTAQTKGGSIFNSLVEEISLSQRIPFSFNKENLSSYLSVNFKHKSISINPQLRYENHLYKRIATGWHEELSTQISTFFPSIFTKIKLSKWFHIKAGYNRRVSIPSYAILDPNITGVTSNSTLSKGNIELAPQFSNQGYIKLTALNFIYIKSTILTKKVTNLPVTEIYDIPSAVTFTTLRPFKNYRLILLNLGLPIPFNFNKGIVASLKSFGYNNPNKLNYMYINLEYQRDVFDQNPYHNQLGNLSLNTNAQIIIKDQLKSFIQYTFYSKGAKLTNRITKNYHDISLRLTNRYFNNALRLTLSLYNLFNLSQYRLEYQSDRLISQTHRTHESFRVKLMASYSFGRFKTKNKIKLDSEESNEYKDTKF